ncbi:membrane fusion protein (multidrug efflux system) [Candidatus Pelagibacter ubique]|uniref:Membrane fusion protein (Multidrug efflux system) n=1 Tax=Pelagibacter ubique TaxID=198252 RepID=A0ABX1T2Z7_PELUQ|nr:efflux RND transporter periplasmic adaptor subunit [Candidatus Pelagibacter ubique]NMN67439.1 membrane fusion protein (multidrug efflux system) [Candidatus Pelagibacter ubique]
MKRSTKVTSLIIIFFLVIAIVVISRVIIGNHFAKKFSKRPPPGIIVTEVVKTDFSEKIESFGTAVSKKNESYRIKRSDLIAELNLKKYVKKGDLILELKDRNITAPFDGILGFRGITGDILDSNNSIIITLDDNSIIYSDLKIPEIFVNVIKKGLPITAKFSGNKEKHYTGTVYAVSSRINAETRSVLIRVKIDNKDAELIPGSLLEVTINYNERNSLGIPDTSIMLEGDKIYVYKVSEKNITDKTEIKIGIRNGGYVEVLSGLNEGENIVAEGLKKVRSKGKIKPIEK